MKTFYKKRLGRVGHLMVVGILSLILWLPKLALAGNEMSTADHAIKPTVTTNLFKKAKENDHWKLAFLTGAHEQVVFMSISPQTNPKNEIGMETHPFDQVIVLAEGTGKAILEGKEFKVGTGDMIFIPKGTRHNVINSNGQKALKIISFYSSRDIPANADYPAKADEPAESGL